MPKMSEEHMLAQRDRIVRAAAKCFTRKGVEATSVQDICAQSRLSVGGIYRHFENKRAIVRQLFIASDEMNRQSLGELVEPSASGDDEVRLADVLGRLLGAFASRGAADIVKLGLSLHAESVRDEDIADLLRRQLAYVREAFASGIRSAQERGDFRDDVDPDSVAAVIVALFEGLKPQLAVDRKFNVGEYRNTLEILMPGLFRAS